MKIDLPKKMADWPESYQEDFRERAAIMEFCGNMTRAVAEKLAEQDIRNQAQQ